MFGHLELVEKDYFGLQFLDLTPPPEGVPHGHVPVTSYAMVNLITTFDCVSWDLYHVLNQCRLNAWAHWAVARGPHEHRSPCYSMYVLYGMFFFNV